jgi:hypothetical protein
MHHGSLVPSPETRDQLGPEPSAVARGWLVSLEVTLPYRDLIVPVE